LLWPLLTSRSGSLRRPFRRKARSPRIRTRSVTAQPPDLRRLALTTRASRLLARSPCSASPRYPVLVHRLAASLHASFPRSVTLTQLRFTSLAMVYSWEDFHLQDRAHAGRTKMRGMTEPLVTPRDRLGVRSNPFVAVAQALLAHLVLASACLHQGGGCGQQGKQCQSA